MFGLSSFFSALSRLTSAVTRSAELFEVANAHLEQQLGFDAPPALSAPEGDQDAEPARRNGRRKAAV